MRRIILALALIAAVAAVGGAANPAGAEPVAISTSPFLVLPGTNFTASGPAVTCPVPGSQLILEAVGVTGPAVVAEGVPISTTMSAASGAAAGVYELDAICLEYGGGSTVVGDGWLTITQANGLPPSDGTMMVSTDDLTWGETCTITAPEGVFAEGTPVEAWMYSDPVLLGTFNASATGSVVGDVTMPAGAALGAHTFVLAGTAPTGKPVFLTVGVTVGQAAGTTTTTAAANTTTTAAPGTGVGTNTNTNTNTGSTGTTSTGTLPQTGGGIGLALPAAGLVGLGSVFAWLAHWRERVQRARC